MSEPATSGTLSGLKAEASRYAWYGTGIALLAVVLATLLVCVHVYDGITLDNIQRAHRENAAIWILNALPFLYALWGQYASWRVSHTARGVVDRRTSALHAEKEELAERARLRTDFFARMSHELRTPLNAILGLSDLLLKSDLDRRQRERVEVIQESAGGLLTVINDVLDFSRMETGHIELDEVEFNLRESLEGATTLLTSEAERKGLVLACELPAEMPTWVTGDPGRLRQVMINLLGNAIKFTDQGSVTLRLAHWHNEGSGRIALDFEVADTGPGIAADDRANLFEPYSRAENERKSGTGLGLSITRQLVEAMGGRIEVDSELGSGSVFRLRVQLGEAEAIDLATLSRQVELQGTRLLLAEAPSQARDALAGQLRALGLQVTTAGDGHQALSLARQMTEVQQRGAIVLADMFLPEISGETLGRTLLEDDATRYLTIAMLTSAGVRGDARRLQAIGFSGYLVRPIPPEDVGDLLRALLAVQSLPPAQRHRQGFVTRHYLREHRSRSRRVLLVEDSAVNREVMQAMVERLGCPVDCAETASAALDEAASRDYAVVLMDLHLPDQNGSRAIEQLRQLEGVRSRVPVIVFTAGATEVEKGQCRRAGADGFLLKPAPADELRAALSRYVDVAAGGAVATEDEAEPSASGEEVDAELARIFLREAAQRMVELRKSAGGCIDPELFARHAHALRSASRHVTTGPLPEAAAELEERALRGDVEGITTVSFPALEAAWRRLQWELKANAPDTASRSAVH